STGGWGIWISPGTYAYVVTASYGTFGPYVFQVAGPGGAGNPAGPAFAVNFANSGVTAFQGDFRAANENPITHTLTSEVFNGVQNVTSTLSRGGADVGAE